ITPDGLRLLPNGPTTGAHTRTELVACSGRLTPARQHTAISRHGQREPSDGVLDCASGFFEVAGPGLILEDDFAGDGAGMQAAAQSAAHPHRLGLADCREQGPGGPERVHLRWLAWFVPLNRVGAARLADGHLGGELKDRFVSAVPSVDQVHVYGGGNLCCCRSRCSWWNPTDGHLQLWRAGVLAADPAARGEVAGGAVAVVQFGDRPVYRHDVLGAAGVEVEQLRRGGVGDEEVGALRPGGWLGVGMAVQDVGDALGVWAEQAVVEVSLV